MADIFKLLVIGGAQGGAVVDFSTDIFSPAYADVITFVILKNYNTCGVLNVVMDYTPHTPDDVPIENSIAN